MKSLNHISVALLIGLLAVAGCGSSNGGNDGGDSDGGMVGTAMVRVAHLAPEVPAEGDTAVDILVDGAASGITDLSFGEITPFVTLDEGSYTFGVAAAGSTESVLDVNATLEDGGVYTVIAYRDSAETVPVQVFLVVESTAGLMTGMGRVVVAHGADDSVLDPVDVINTDAPSPPVIDDFAFGTTESLDLAEGTVNIGFDVTENGEPDAGPLAAPVTADIVTILVAVDEDTDDESLDPQVYAILPTSTGTLTTLAPPSS